MVAITVVAAAVVAITVFTVQHYGAATDAASVLGIVVPVFATVGAAAFGVQVAYQAGSTTGGNKAAQITKANMAGVLAPQIQDIQTALEPLLRTIEREGTSSQGSSLLQIAPTAAPIDFDQENIAAIRQSLAAVDSTVTGLTK